MASSAVTPKEKRRGFFNDVDKAVIFFALADLYRGGRFGFSIVFGILSALCLICFGLGWYAEILRRKAREVPDVQP